MSDIEEPPAKVTKIELAPPSVESATEGPEDGQEEWLSEGVLTDDDYNPGAEQDRSDSNLGNTSQDGSMRSLNENSMENIAKPADQENVNHSNRDTKSEQNIEQTLNSLENSQTNDPNILTDDLDAFLIRKTDGKVLETKVIKEEVIDKESEIDESIKQSDEEDDGHNTDDLLRMLGEDDEKVNKNKVLKTIKEKKSLTRGASSSDDDDDYIFEGAKVTRLKVAKNALIRKYPATKAVPEDLSDRDSDSEMSSDEANTMKKIFGMTRQVNVASKSTTKSAVTLLKRTVPNLPANPDKRPSQPTPLKQYVNKNLQVSSVAKGGERPQGGQPPKQQPQLEESDEIINETEFLEEDDFDLDEEFAEDSEGEEGEEMRRERQRLLHPEQMDEEVPTDGESHSEDGSLYDELPSSDSEDLDEWFTLDIRAERAGDYIPLLGAKAHQLLTEEKQRVSSRLTALRHSLSALTDSGRQQAEQLRKANNTLAELDAMLTAS